MVTLAAGARGRGGGGRGPGGAGTRTARSWRPGNDMRPSRPRPWQAVAVAETAGSVGSGGRPAGESWECDGSVTEEGPRHGERGKSTLPCVLSNSHGRDAWIDPPIGG